jgi:murein DD-endopeptidase MepM/ murein hydrolase activator NlpD
MPDCNNTTMKYFTTRTYNLGKLSIIRNADHYIILYRGRNGVSLKKINTRFAAPPMIRMACVALLIFGLVLGSSIFISEKLNRARTSGSDEEIKNALIQSTSTDFSAPADVDELKIRTHTIVKGETLSQIAKEFGVSLDTLRGNNKLSGLDVVQVGTRLRIPSKDGILYTIKKGQNLHSVSAAYRVPVEKILSQNTFRNFDFICEGTEIFIPDAKPLDIIPGFLWPAAGKRITCGYGWRRNPFSWSEREFHQGMDMRSDYQWVKATRYGKVTFAGWLGGYGKAVLIAHPNGWKSLYGHLSRIIVKEGQYVKQGQFIAKSGNTGLSTGAHLHFELIRNGRDVNPNRYVK